MPEYLKISDPDFKTTYSMWQALELHIETTMEDEPFSWVQAVMNADAEYANFHSEPWIYRIRPDDP